MTSPISDNPNPIPPAAPAPADLDNGQPEEKIPFKLIEHSNHSSFSNHGFAALTSNPFGVHIVRSLHLLPSNGLSTSQAMRIRRHGSNVRSDQISKGFQVSGLGNLDRLTIGFPHTPYPKSTKSSNASVVSRTPTNSQKDTITLHCSLACKSSSPTPTVEVRQGFRCSGGQVTQSTNRSHFQDRQAFLKLGRSSNVRTQAFKLSMEHHPNLNYFFCTNRIFSSNSLLISPSYLGG